ncbi:MAG TPA: hypothetical protein VHT96_12905 [Clostridia bacterium]|nr:hypothetical protein [Clostridia bacterium]
MIPTSGKQVRWHKLPGCIVGTAGDGAAGEELRDKIAGIRTAGIRTAVKDVTG